MPSRTSVAAALAAAMSLVSTSSAHSWIEQMNVVAQNGSFSGTPGFARGNVLRSEPVNIDQAMVYLLPPDGRDTNQGILKSDTMCFPGHQQQASQTSNSPRLKAAPGDLIALRYQENGHVTIPENQPGKPDNRGTVYVYGTTQPSPDDKFLDIFGKWTADGSGGNKKGKLLATYNFDDGQCYQQNGGKISLQRQKEFPIAKPTDPMGMNLWCQNDVTLPKDAPSGKPYTMYWVWNWPTKAGTEGVPNGKIEIYTTCMDIDVQGSQTSSNKAAVQFDKGQPVNSAAVPAQVSAMAAGKPFIAPTPVPEKLIGGSSQAPNAAPAPSKAPAAPASAAPAAAPAAAAPVAAASSAPAAPAPAGSQPPAAAQPPAAQAPNAAPAPSKAPAAPASAAPAAAPAAAAPVAAASAAPAAPAPAGSQPPAVAQPPAAQQPQGKTVTVSAPPKTVTVGSVVAPSGAPAASQASTPAFVPTPAAASKAQSTEPGVPTISLSNTFSGTAKPMPSKDCKKQKRSRVFGRSINEHLAAHISSSAAAQATGAAKPSKTFTA